MNTWNNVVYWYAAVWISGFWFVYPLLLDLSNKSEFFMLRIIIVLIINLDNYSVLLCLVIVMLYVPAIRVSAEMIFEMYYKVNDSFILEREKQEEFITYAW